MRIPSESGMKFHFVSLHKSEGFFEVTVAVKEAVEEFGEKLAKYLGWGTKSE